MNSLKEKPTEHGVSPMGSRFFFRLYTIYKISYHNVIMYFMRVERDVFLHEGVKSRDLPQEKIFHLPNKELLI